MKKKKFPIDPVWRIFISYLLLIFFILLAGGLSAQTPCKEDICVVEFNAGWNETNSVKYLDDDGNKSRDHKNGDVLYTTPPRFDQSQEGPVVPMNELIKPKRNLA